jgi:hypothetical protein
MVSHYSAFAGILAVGLILPLSSQSASPIVAPLTDQGQITIAGKPTAYVIHHLPISSFPELPAPIADQLTRRGCTIPQTYEAHHPENVIHASLLHPGSSDWAILCSVQGTVSLLVFFDDATTQPAVVASELESARLQPHDPGGALGFNWGIDPATPQQVHDAQMGMVHRPTRIDHDALADSTVDHKTIYRFYVRGAWSVLETSD